jgi:branched-chain amino acid aminotransferase
MWVFWDEKFVNRNKAFIDIDNRSFRYGDGFFETIKVINGSIPLWAYHAQRLQQTANQLGFDLPTYMDEAYFKKHILDLIAKNAHTACVRVRLTFYRGNGGLFDAVSPRPNILIQSWPLAEANNELNENGLECLVYEGGFKAADKLANLKTNNYLLYALAALEAKNNRKNDAWVLNHLNEFADSTIANIWVCKAGVWHTPPLEAGGVRGTMRQYLLETLPGHGFRVQETVMDISFLRDADAVFHSNAIYGIKWVKQVGDYTFLPGTIPLLFDRAVKPLWGSTK